MLQKNRHITLFHLVLALTLGISSCSDPSGAGSGSGSGPGTDPAARQEQTGPPSYELSLTLDYPKLKDGTELYRWDGTETVGLLFGSTDKVPAQDEYESPGLVAKALPSKEKGVFSGKIDLGEWSLDDLVAVIFPYDEHSWVKNGKEGGLRVAIHSAGRHGKGDIVYSQKESGKFNPLNAPVFARISKKDLTLKSSAGNLYSYSGKASLNWGTALLCINIYGQAATSLADEHVEGISLFANAAKAVVGNTEHKADGTTAINGNSSNLACVKLEQSPALEDTDIDNGIRIYTALAVRGPYAFNEGDKGYISVKTDKSTYVLPLEKKTYNLSQGVVDRMDVDLSSCGRIFKAGAGKGSIRMEGKGAFEGRSYTLNYYIPDGDISTMPVQFVMHGVDRNGDVYRDEWIDAADKYGIAVLAPTFTEEEYPEAYYQTGNIVDKHNKFNTQDKMIYTVIEDLFDFFLANSESKATTYNLWGHSAGGQFAQRFLLFADAPRAARIVAANPGWYTFPDETISFPYGWGDVETAIPEITKEKNYAKDFTLMLGTSDTKRDSNLRTTPQADAQGQNRYERGTNFFKWCQADATKKNLDFKWTKVEVPGVGHSHSQMGPAAAVYLYGIEE